MIATIASLNDHVGQEVTLQGWLYNSRDSGKIAFLVLRDGTGLCQCVVTKGEQTVVTVLRAGKEMKVNVTW